MSKKTNRQTYTPDPEARRKSIGASDVPSILGLNRYRSAWDVWAEKTGRVIPDESANRAAEAGRYFETSILNWAEEQLGEIQRTIELSTNGDLGFPLVVHLDGRVKETGDPVEAKSSGLFSPLHADWGEDGTDDVPDYVFVQTQTQLLVSKRELCHVPAFLGGRGFTMFRLISHAELQKILVDKCGEFWNDYVLTDTPPPDSAPSLDVAKRIKRIPALTVDIPPAIVQTYLDASENAKIAEKAKREAQALVLKALGDAEAGTVEGIGTMTYYEQTRKEHIVPASTFRVLRLKKAKG